MPHEGSPNRLCKLPRARLLAGRIAVDGRVAAGFRKLVCRFAQDDVDAGVGWADEGGQEFGCCARAAPVPGRQEIDFDLAFGERLVGDSTRTISSARREAVRPERNAWSSLRSTVVRWWTSASAMRSMRQTPGVTKGGSEERWTETSRRSTPVVLRTERSRMIGMAFW